MNRYRGPIQLGIGFLMTLGLLFLRTTQADDSSKKSEAPKITWDSLEARMKWEADQGFSGIVLVARDGKIVFHKAYGLANRDKKIVMQPDTILGIGSTPIDFTKASILLLADQKKLSLKDPITQYWKDVPEDKKKMTIDHLMTGRSGLQDFHDISTDRDPDHSWIDRDEAVKRILAQKLLFEPGSKRKHSHSAFGLLAAIVEIVSGKTYQEFTRENLYKPAGMKDTKFFGEEYPEERMAIGYGPKKDGKINAPPYWGKTSWLVMGSGGQVSTAEDMWRWTQAIRSDKILSKESLQYYHAGGDGMLLGGDMYGFEIFYAGTDRSFMVLMSNNSSAKRFPQIRQLGEELTGLVIERKANKFSLGIMMDIRENGRVKLEEVVPKGAADQAGLKAGDILLKANGKLFGERPAEVLGSLLQTGNPIEFEIERDNKRQTITVKPLPREEKK
jgi:CubicO group peptidase (beta-lactamase class C family)